MIINVVDHGAVGNGVADDTAAINATIALLTEYDALYFPAGTYLVKAPPPPPQTIAILPLHEKNLKIYGDGIGISIIKLADSCPDFQTIFGDSIQAPGYEGRIAGLEVCDITFDLNIDGNPIYPGKDLQTWQSAAIVCYHGAVYNIHDIEITNSSSYYLLYFINATDITVTDSIFSNVGDFLLGTPDVGHDMDVIWVNGEGPCNISHNHFSCSAIHLGGGKAAIEMHCSNWTIEDNVIENFYLGIWAVSDGETENMNVLRNEISGCNVGVMIWSYNVNHLSLTGYGIDGILIQDNTIDLETSLATWYLGEGTEGGIVVHPQCDLDINDLVIDGNTISVSAVPLAILNDYLAGISFVNWHTPAYTLSNVTITNNVITNMPGAGLRLSYPLDAVIIENNTLTNCGSAVTGEPSDDSPIRLGTKDIGPPPYLPHVDINDVRIIDNTFIDSVPVTRIKNWIELATTASSTGLVFSGNSYSLTGDGAVFDRQFLINDNTVQPLLTETIADFAPPTHKVNSASVVIDGITTWRVEITGLIWTGGGYMTITELSSAATWASVIDLPQITVTGLSTGNAVRLYDSAGNIHASAVESGGTATLTYTLD